MGCNGLRFAPPVLRKPRKNEAVTDELRQPMLGWHYAGFSAHNEVRVAPEDAEGRKKFAGYMLRATILANEIPDSVAFPLPFSYGKV